MVQSTLSSIFMQTAKLNALLASKEEPDQAAIVYLLIMNKLRGLKVDASVLTDESTDDTGNGESKGLCCYWLKFRQFSASILL